MPRTQIYGQARRQLFTTDHFQSRQIFSNKRPHDGCRDIFVIVAQHIADTGHFMPRDFRMPGFQFIREMAACFRKISTPRSTSHCLCHAVSNVSREMPLPSQCVDAFDGLDDIRQPEEQAEARHSEHVDGSFFDLPALRVLCRLSRVMISAFRPRIRRRTPSHPSVQKDQIFLFRNRKTDRRRRSSFASPRAVEPNM